MSATAFDTSPSAAGPAVVSPLASVDPSCEIGPGCRIGAGAFIGAGVWLEAQVEVDANAVLEGGRAEAPAVRVHAGVRIGANATICAGVVLARDAAVRPGAVVTRSVPPRAIVEGNPAAIVGYVDTGRETVAVAGVASSPASVKALPVQGVTLHRFPVVADLRGNLTVGEFERSVPFAPKRYFMVFGVPGREVRGEHAHRVCHQFLICVRGSCSVVADDGKARTEVALDDLATGLYLPPMTWGIQYKYSPDAVLLVFASHYYDNADYVRNYDEFLQLAARS